MSKSMEDEESRRKEVGLAGIKCPFGEGMDFLKVIRF